jgi:hypothetical protein
MMLPIRISVSLAPGSYRGSAEAQPTASTVQETASFPRRHALPEIEWLPLRAIKRSLHGAVGIRTCQTMATGVATIARTAPWARLRMLKNC